MCPTGGLTTNTATRGPCAPDMQGHRSLRINFATQLLSRVCCPSRTYPALSHIWFLAASLVFQQHVWFWSSMSSLIRHPSMDGLACPVCVCVCAPLAHIPQAWGHRKRGFTFQYHVLGRGVHRRHGLPVLCGAPEGDVGWLGLCWPPHRLFSDWFCSTAAGLP